MVTRSAQNQRPTAPSGRTFSPLSCRGSRWHQVDEMPIASDGPIEEHQ